MSSSTLFDNNTFYDAFARDLKRVLPVQLAQV